MEFEFKRIQNSVKANCGNCHQNFPEMKILLHESYCIKHVRKCINCDDFIDNSMIEEHNDEKYKK